MIIKLNVGGFDHLFQPQMKGSVLFIVFSKKLQ